MALSATEVLPAPVTHDARLVASRRWWWRAAFPAGIAMLAFVVRLVPVLLGGGLDFYGRYDDAVYYTASEALTFGRVPYRDFVLLHPPGLMLALVPFALLGRLTSDPVGMAVGRVAFMAIGALNAVLVAALAKRWGLLASVIAGLLYACWMPAVYGEQSTMLEPLGTALTLATLLLLCRPGMNRTSRRAELLAGVALGLAPTFKIWYVAPLVVVLIWLLACGRYRSALRVASAGAASATLVLLPFFVLAPGQMFRMIVLDQVGSEGAGATSRLTRLAVILGTRPVVGRHWPLVDIATAIGLIGVAVVALICVRDVAARLIVAILGANLLVLLAAPDFYPHYPELTAAPIALVVGIGLANLWQRRSLIAKPTIAALGVVTVVSGLRVATTPTGYVFPRAEFEAVAPSGCVTADDPQALIDMNRLTSDFREGCLVPVDVSGITYDRLVRVDAAGVRVDRADNAAWQSYLHDYLLSGSCFVVLRANVDLMTPLYRHLMRRTPVLARADGLTLREGIGGGSVEVDGVEAAGSARHVRRLM